MTERPHLVIPADDLATFAHDDHPGGDARHLSTLMRASRSRMTITTVSPDPSLPHRTRIWMQPGTCVVARTAVGDTGGGDTGELEAHVYQIDSEEAPHVAAAASPLTPNPALFDGPPSLPTAFVYAAQQGMRHQAARLLEELSTLGPPDSAFAASLVTLRWAYTTWIREDCTDEDSFVPTSILSTLITPAASYRVEAPLLAPSTGPHIPIHPAYNTQLWASITHFFALSPERNQP